MQTPTLRSRPARLAAAVAFAAMSLLTACSETRDDEPSIFEAFGEGSGECPTPCLFGTECIDGACTIPCDPACEDGEVCRLGFCVEVEPEPVACNPTCGPTERCVGGVCVPADGCFPPCVLDQLCTASGACVADDACFEDDECAPGDRCIGGACVAPIDWTPSAATSALVHVELPDVLGPDECCFDFDGDGTPDNALAGLSALFATLGLADIEGGWDEAIADGSMLYVLDFAGLVGATSDIDLGIVPVTNDLNGDGWTDQEFEERAAGDGEYRIERDAVGPYGPETRFPRATLTRGTLDSGVGELTFPLPAGALLAPGDDLVPYTLYGARLAGELQVEDDGVRSREVPLGRRDTASSLRVGGAIRAVDWVDTLNLGALRCDCAALGPGQAVFRVAREEGELIVVCDENVVLDACLEAEDDCAALPPLCEALPLVSRFGPWDVDTDGDGFGDAVSVGMRWRIVPATIVR